MAEVIAKGMEVTSQMAQVILDGWRGYFAAGGGYRAAARGDFVASRGSRDGCRGLMEVVPRRLAGSTG